MKQLGLLLLLLTIGCDGYYGYPNPEEGCFPAGTRIRVPSGEQNIESLQAGDTVYAFDEESGQLVTGVIDAVRQRSVTKILTMVLDNGTSLQVTEDHPLYLAESLQWQEAGQMQPTDALMILNAENKLEAVRIVSITPEESPAAIPVYNFKVREYMTSFAQGVLAHFYDD